MGNNIHTLWTLWYSNKIHTLWTLWETKSTLCGRYGIQTKFTLFGRYGFKQNSHFVHVMGFKQKIHFVDVMENKIHTLCALWETASLLAVQWGALRKSVTSKGHSVISDIDQRPLHALSY